MNCWVAMPAWVRPRPSDPGAEGTSLRSRPAQKPRPAPVRTTTRYDGSAAISSSRVCRSRTSSMLMAFNRSGRSRVSRAMPGRMVSRRTVDMTSAFHGASDLTPPVPTVCQAREVRSGEGSGQGRRAVLVTPHPVDLMRTLAPLRGAGRLRFAADGVWQVTRTVDGPATVQIEPRHSATAPVTARAWGAGADRALSHLPDLVGFHDHPDDFAPVHPVLREQHRRHPALRLGRTRSIAEILLPTIVEQKVATADAMRSWRGVRARFAEPAPGPADLVLPPDPARLAHL